MQYGDLQFFDIIIFAAIAGWIILNQVLDTQKIMGCLAIFVGVIIVQLVPILIKQK